MGGKRCILWITWWLWTIMDYSFTWMLATHAHFMMSPFCVNHIYTKINSSFLCIRMKFWICTRGPTSLGEEIFVMHQLGRCECALGHDQNIINVYDNMLVGYNVRVEWGIGELKWKWRWLMKCFDFTKSKNNHLFHVTTIFTIFLLKCWMNFTYEIISDQIMDPIYYG